MALYSMYRKLIRQTEKVEVALSISSLQDVPAHSGMHAKGVDAEAGHCWEYPAGRKANSLATVIA